MNISLNAMERWTLSPFFIYQSVLYSLFILPPLKKKKEGRGGEGHPQFQTIGLAAPFFLTLIHACASTFVVLQVVFTMKLRLPVCECECGVTTRGWRRSMPLTAKMMIMKTGYSHAWASARLQVATSAKRNASAK